MGLVLLIIVILLLVGAFPRWNYSRNWGYGPTGVLDYTGDTADTVAVGISSRGF